MADAAVVLEIDLVIEDERWSDALPDMDDLVQGAVKAAYDVAGFSENVAICLLLADDTRLKELNRDFRDKDKPTNVLSFPMQGEAMPGEPRQLGDIAISFDTVEREAGEFDRPLLNHTLHLIVHGSLHLIGYTHDDPQDAEQMEALEITALGRLDIPSPYEITEGVES